MLILFDIDGTMLLTQRAGMMAFHEAATALLGRSMSLDGVQIAGSLDPRIWNDLATRNGVADPAALHDEFRARYIECFTRRMTEQPTARALPGVVGLLEVLRREEGITLGVLTGNYPETGLMKIEHAGIDPTPFAVRVWGTDGAVRRELPGVAMGIYNRSAAAPIEPSRVVIIGDTPADVDCARHHGCRSLAVATGPFDESALRAAGADRVVPDLAETPALAAWLREG